MRRMGGLWEQVVAFGNLLRAARNAARGKREVAGVARFLERIEPRLLALQRELAGQTWRPGVTASFVVRDPKVRTITVAPFEDRVVHHALIDVLEPWLERRMVGESFACRRGKGTHAALDHAQRMVRRHGWFLKLDVRRFFPSLEHDVALETLARVVKDRRVLELAERIVRDGGGSGRGLPIGNLTSQWLANLVLDRLDHVVKERLRVPGYVRYMDDFVLFADGKEGLQHWHGEVAAFLRDELRLALKQRATVLAPCTNGLPFLGWRLYRGTRRLRPENRRRALSRLRHRRWQHRTGRITESGLAAAARSLCAHLEHGQTRALRRRWLDRMRHDRPP